MALLTNGSDDEKSSDHKHFYSNLRLAKVNMIREAFAEIPPRVEYSLTETGKSLVPILNMMIDWSLGHFEEVTK